MRPHHLVLALAVLPACSDYSLFGRKEDPELVEDTDVIAAPDDTDTGEIPDEDCPQPDLAVSTTSIDESCVVEREEGTFNPRVEWEDIAVGPSYATPVVGQLTDDDGNGKIDAADMPDIVIVTQRGNGAVLSGDGSGEHWSIGGLSTDCPSAPAIGDLNGDGRPEVVFASGGTVQAHEGKNGGIVWKNTTSGVGDLTYCGAIGIYDLDADGQPEVVIGSAIFDGFTGALRGKGGAGAAAVSGTWAAVSVAADVDADGDLEVVVGNALYDADGNTIWSNGQSDGYPAVANFDADPQGEIVVTNTNGQVRLQDDDGKVLWTTVTWGLGDLVGPPAVADLDGDGEPEIGVAGRAEYAVFDADGTKKWSQTISDTSSGYAGSSIFDFEGDGDLEIVYADEKYVYAFAGATGMKKMQLPHSSATTNEYPVIADVDNDGSAEIIRAMSPYGSGAFSGLQVIGDKDDSWMPARQVWNQHAYAITNVDDLGGIPDVCDPNWPDWNSFRAGNVGGLETPVADAVALIGDLCAVDCDEGTLTAVARVGNGGTADLPAGIPVSLYASSGGTWNLVSTQTTAAEIAPGATSEGLAFEVPAADATEGLRIVVDEGGAVIGEDCHPENDTVEITDGLCP